MKRRSIFKAAALIASRSFGHAQPAGSTATRAVQVAAGSDRFDKTPKPRSCKVSAKDTNGQMCIFEERSSTKGGPPVHLHTDQDEWFHVLEGEYKFQVGNEKFSMKAGDSVLGPRAIPHAFSKVGSGPWNMLLVYQPAGDMEAFFNELEQLKGRPTREQFETLFQNHGMKIVGSPLPTE